MKELQIIVAGQANTGKSTMLLWLEQVLLDAGFTIEMDFETELLDHGTEARFRRAMAQHVTKRENAVMKNTKIILTSKQTHRDSQKK